MSKIEAVAVTTEQAELGEGPRWDARRGELLRVDILAGRVFRDRVRADGSLEPVRDYRLPVPVGALAPLADGDGWLLAAGRGFLHLAEDGTVRPVAPEVSPEGTRMNDGACDPQGRFWAGTLAHDARPGGGALYRLDRHGLVTRMLDGLTISNGLGWSPDGTTMYLADSGAGTVRAFAFDGAAGTIDGARTLIDLTEGAGSPDGLTVDADGDLWIALWGVGRVHRYSPEGELKQAYEIPAEQSTCCAFAGAELTRLYVTTATEHWTAERRRAEPGAGLVYRIDIDDAKGRPVETFRPGTAWWATVRG